MTDIQRRRRYTAVIAHSLDGCRRYLQRHHSLPVNPDADVARIDYPSGISTTFVFLPYSETDADLMRRLTGIVIDDIEMSSGDLNDRGRAVLRLAQTYRGPQPDRPMFSPVPPGAAPGDLSVPPDYCGLCGGAVGPTPQSWQLHLEHAHPPLQT